MVFAMSTLRDRKKQRTRQAIIDAATELFARQGYERTTIAEIAAAADIGTRTFFSYFATKEELLFPQADDRVRVALETIAKRSPGDSPAEVLLRAVRDAAAADNEMVSPLAALRMDLIQTVPSVRGYGLHLQVEAGREIAHHLRGAYPDELDEVSASALVGAMMGAVSGALLVLLEDREAIALGPEHLKERVHQAMDVALGPWVHSAAERSPASESPG
jgi:AcrR family transcriptional regulator